VVACSADYFQDVIITVVAFFIFFVDVGETLLESLGCEVLGCIDGLAVQVDQVVWIRVQLIKDLLVLFIAQKLLVFAQEPVDLVHCTGVRHVPVIEKLDSVICKEGCFMVGLFVSRMVILSSVIHLGTPSFLEQLFKIYFCFSVRLFRFCQL
jgi:hypothetical protein